MVAFQVTTKERPQRASRYSPYHGTVSGVEYGFSDDDVFGSHFGPIEAELWVDGGVGRELVPRRRRWCVVPWEIDDYRGA